MRRGEGIQIQVLWAIPGSEGTLSAAPSLSPVTCKLVLAILSETPEEPEQ